MKHRFENFGGIISSEDPPFLAFVDRTFMRELGLGDSPMWENSDDQIGVLSAPTEVHLAATNACPGKCEHCYMNAGERDPGEMDTTLFKRVLRELAEMGVFHVALGGGEALSRADIFELAEYAREVGLVPNLTVSGSMLTPEMARRMKVFGQVNVSVDGVGPFAGAFRGDRSLGTADKAIGLLVSAGVPTGINCVVGRSNFDGIPDLFRYAKGKGTNEIEFLRLKPGGRGGRIYDEQKTTFAQNARFIPMLRELSEQYGMTAKIDCSFIPMLCYHNPPRDMLERLGTYGCEAANVLLGIRSDGTVNGCSFLQDGGPSVFELRHRWKTDEVFRSLRTWTERAPEPCRSCSYLNICKGGCHAVASYVSGDLSAPDPDCPWVVERDHGQARSGA